MSPKPFTVALLIGYVLLWIGLVALLMTAAGCTTTGNMHRAVAREAQQPHFHPSQAIEPLIAFQKAVEQQSAAGGFEPEQFGLVMRWIGAGLSTLRGPHPEEWEAVARTEWNAVKSAVGPYEPLSPYIRLIESLIQ